MNFDNLHIVPSTRVAYRTLAPYHYIKRQLPPVDSIYAVRDKLPSLKRYPDPLSIIVYSMPLIHLRARNIATKNFFTAPPTRREQLCRLNKNVRYISRLITDPRYHKQGLATWLLETTLAKQTIPIIETLTPIDFTNKIFQRAGFELYYNPAPPHYQKFIEQLRSHGISGDILRHPRTAQKRIDRLKPEDQEWFYHHLKRFLHGLKNIEPKFWAPEAIVFALRQLTYPHAYLIWHNPHFEKSRKNQLYTINSI